MFEVDLVGTAHHFPQAEVQREAFFMEGVPFC